MKRGTPRHPSVPATRSRLRRVREETGQVLILMTLAMFLILGLSAYALDAAQLAVAHHQAQVAADSAALSAAQDMSTTTTPTTTIDNDGTVAATTNDPNATATISQPTSLKGEAQINAPVSLPFGRVFGFGSGSVGAQAVAQVNTAVTNVDGTILSVGCGNSSSSNCTYVAGALIPTGANPADDGWQVTSTAEDPTDNYTPSGGTAGETTVNLQTCQGSQGNGSCYEPDSGTPVSSNNLTEVVDLNGESEGGMWQTVPTTIGARYVLNFWLTGNPALNGWPGPSNNQFPVDVWITDGSDTPYTPSVNEASPPTNVCNGSHPSDYINCGWWDYQDEQCGDTNADNVTLSNCTGGQEEADFSTESLSFIAKSTETTITFNSETNDGDQMDGSRGWFYCGPEIANIALGYPEIQLVQ